MPHSTVVSHALKQLLLVPLGSRTSKIHDGNLKKTRGYWIAKTFLETAYQLMNDELVIAMARKTIILLIGGGIFCRPIQLNDASIRCMRACFFRESTEPGGPYFMNAVSGTLRLGVNYNVLYIADQTLANLPLPRPKAVWSINRENARVTPPAKDGTGLYSILGNRCLRV